MNVAPEPDHEAAQRDLGALPVWDAGALARIVGNNPDAHVRLLTKYRESANAAMAEMQLWAQAGEWHKVAASAHKLKSSSRSVGAMRLGQLCEALEYAGQRGEAAACAALVPSLVAGLAELDARL